MEHASTAKWRVQDVIVVREGQWWWWKLGSSWKNISGAVFIPV
jgi:hypothetical protein